MAKRKTDAAGSSCSVRLTRTVAVLGRAGGYAVAPSILTGVAETRSPS